MLVNQGLLGIAFFEATAFIILLVLFLIFQRDHINRYFRLWVTGWLVFTLASLCEVAMLSRNFPQLWMWVVRLISSPLLPITVLRWCWTKPREPWR